MSVISENYQKIKTRTSQNSTSNIRTSKPTSPPPPLPPPPQNAYHFPGLHRTANIPNFTHESAFNRPPNNIPTYIPTHNPQNRLPQNFLSTPFIHIIINQIITHIINIINSASQLLFKTFNKQLLLISVSPMAQNNSNHRLILMNWNACGISNKKNELHFFLQTNNVDIACITESHLKPPATFKLPGYNTARMDRANSPGGGVIILIKNTIAYFEENNNIHQWHRNNSSFTYQTPTRIITIIAAYKPPNKRTNFTDLNNLLSRLSSYIF